MKVNKLAIAVLAVSLTQTVSADDTVSNAEAEATGTYWGIGIGSVLGGVIAGPPGAALGATLGGSIGWGQGKDLALDISQQELNQRELALTQSQDNLQHQRIKLNETSQKISVLSRENARQSARLAALIKEEARDQASSKAILQGLIEHYAQEVYFRNGESDVPDYAQGRLTRLTDFLKSHPDLHVQLKGYTDSRGSADFNAALAQARVEGIRTALMAQGVDAQRITTQAVGEAESQARAGHAEAHDIANNVLDRRVSIALSLGEQDSPSIARIAEVSQ